MARDLRLFYLFRLLATSYLWVPIFVYFFESRGLQWSEISILGAIYCGVVILVEIPTGAFADRIGRRRSMMAGTLAMVAACVTAYFAHGFAAFAIAEVLAATSMSLCSGADSAYLFDLLVDNGRADEYAHHEGRASAWHFAGQTLAFAAGGVLAEIDLALPYLATAAVSAAAFGVALLMDGERAAIVSRPLRPAREEARAYFRHMRESLRAARSNRALLWVIGYAAVVFALLKAIAYLYQPLLKAQSFGYAEVGFIFAGVYAVASFVAHQADALRRQYGEDVLVWGVLIALAGSFLLLGQVRSEWVMMLLLVQAIATGLYSPLVKPLLNRQIASSDHRATVLSIESIAKRSFMIGAVFLPIAASYGPAAALYWCGGVGLAGFAVLAAFGRAAPLSGRGAVFRAVVPEDSVPALSGDPPCPSK
ncbi:MAG: MFS transporter [Deltaproteobacteria bacterium]|nr:MAG: MFS transporter [Deltaproteobacteria bacterium]